MIDFKDQDKYFYGPYPLGYDTSAVPPQLVLTLGDPLRIYRTLLLETGGDLTQVLNDCHAKVPPQYKDDGTVLRPESDDLQTQYRATDLIIEATRLAFNMLPFDPRTGRGATDALCMSVFDGFMEWLENFESPGGGTPPSSDTTAGPQVTPSPILTM